MFVYVPMELTGEHPPSEAFQLAKETKLPIRLGEANDGIGKKTVSVVRMPEIKQTDYLRSQKQNLVIPVEYINEFETLPSDIAIYISGNDYSCTFSPYVLEAHHARFRFRIPNRGIYSFVISSLSLGKTYDRGEITID